MAPGRLIPNAMGDVDVLERERTYIALPEAMKPATYDAANRLVKRDGEELAYDKAGNLVEDGESEYEWDARGQLEAIEGPSEASFAYDPFGRRISKTFGEATTGLLYDGPNVAQEYEGEELAATVLSGLEADRLFSRAGAAGEASYLTDRLGSATALADSEGNLDTTYSYEPFGAPTAAGEETDNPFGFTGREYDPTGLQYNRARYYDPSAARFISEDPAGVVDFRANLYEYAGDNPVDFIDPSGYSLQSLGERFVGAIDGETFGTTNWLRENVFHNNNVDRCSRDYRVAYDVGHVTSSVAAGITGGGRAAMALKGAPAAVRAIGGGSIGGATQATVEHDGRPSLDDLRRGILWGAAGGVAGDFARGPQAMDTLGREQLVGSLTGNTGNVLSGHPPSIGEAACGS
jgi:RHS repeat-associated protein